MAGSSIAARYARLAESGIIGLIVTGADFRPLEVNDAFLNMIGYSRQEVLAPTFKFADITPPEWRLTDADAQARLKENGQINLREKEYFHKDGTRVPILAGSAMVGDAGECISFVLDISERKRADAVIRRLAQSHTDAARFRLLLEAAPEAMVVFDRSAKILLVNTRTEQLYGYLRDELLGQPAYMLVAPKSRIESAERLTHFFFEPEVAQRRILFGRRKDGSEFPMEVSASTMAWGDGVAASVVVRDVSERHRVEAALHNTAAQLKAANRELEAFGYSVAHDLRAPLRGISGFAQILFDDYHQQLPPDAADCLTEIRANALRMTSLIDALLALSRVTRGELRPSRVDLSQLARTVGAELAAREPSRPVELVVPEGLVAPMDHALARTLLEHLLGNAWKFTIHQPAPRVELGCTQQDGQTVYFIRDNGAGFDMTYVDKLFTPFQRLHAADEFPGTGIGLASVRRIINRHGGRVWAQGQVGQGATLSFTLPPGAGSSS